MRSLNLLLAALFFGASLSGSAQCGLFFSEYAEGSSNNKYLEIYNPTNVDVDLNDYRLVYRRSDDKTFVKGWVDANIPAGNVYVLAKGGSTRYCDFIRRNDCKYSRTTPDTVSLCNESHDPPRLLRAS